MKRIFIPLLLALTLTACQNNSEPMKPETITYLALGDSYTIGEGIEESGRYPMQLRDSLATRGIAIQQLDVVARTGWTTDELSKAMDQAPLLEKYDLVSLLIGVNNQYRGRSAENYRLEFSALLHRALELSGQNPSRVIVISIPDWGVTPFADGRDRQQIADEIDAFNRINQEEALAAGANWLDVTPISREAATKAELLATDKLHPSALMYSLWVKELLPVVLYQLQNP